MSQRRRHHRSRHKPAVANAGAVELIPAGPVPEAQAGRVEVETVAMGEHNNALVTRQVVSTPVRRLLATGMIGAEHAAAAQRFSDDYELAYSALTNPLAKIQVDSEGGGGSIFAAMAHRAQHGLMFAEAEMFLRARISRVLKSLVLSRSHRDARASAPETGIEASFGAIGAEFLPGASARDQRAGGRAIAVLTLMEAADFYERANLAERRNRRAQQGRITFAQPQRA